MNLPYKTITSKLRIEFIDNKDNSHFLSFNIYNSKLARRWSNLILRNQVNNNAKLNVTFINSADVNKIIADLNVCITNINQVYDKPIKLNESIDKLSIQETNNLHEEFENYGDRIDYLKNQQSKAPPEKIYWTEDLHNNFLRLNELIHLYEEAINFENTSLPNMSVLYDYYPQEHFQPIQESDKIWLRHNLTWGGVYLGYNTLGKDWLKVVLDNDLDVILRDQVKPQERFSAETWINFGPDSNDYYTGIKIENWLSKLDPALRKKVPIDNLNKFCFGRFKIGELLTDTEYFKKYDPDQGNWQLPNTQSKLLWNRNIFSSFVSINSIKLMNNE
jgi:hypothetical protein